MASLDDLRVVDATLKQGVAEVGAKIEEGGTRLETLPWHLVYAPYVEALRATMLDAGAAPSTANHRLMS